MYSSTCGTVPVIVFVFRNMVVNSESNRKQKFLTRSSNGTVRYRTAPYLTIPNILAQDVRRDILDNKKRNQKSKRTCVPYWYGTFTFK